MTLRVLRSAVGLMDLPGALDWTGPPPKAWGQVGTWHEVASASGGIRPMPHHAARTCSPNTQHGQPWILPRWRRLNCGCRIFWTFTFLLIVHWLR